jgi:hypothetical protein
MHDTLYTSLSADLPAQMIPLRKKTEEWKKKNLDSLEAVGRTQYLDNLRLLENFEMVKGRFIYNHYFETEGYTDFMAQLTREFELPSYLRHYDIVSQVINTLSGEYQKRPDIFRIRNHSESAQNEFQRTKTELLVKYVTSQIDAEITAKLLEEGLDPERADFESEEEAQQYQQMVEQARQAKTPEEIQRYMETDWMEAGEIWASHQLALDKDRFQLKEKEKREFEDMLISDRCFRHFYLTPDGYNQETWNPIQVFFQKSPDIDYIEDGDYVGRVYYLSVPAIIDRFGHLMKKEELESLEEDTSINKTKKKWNYTSGSEYVFDEYVEPFKGFEVVNTLERTQGVPKLDSGVLRSLTSGKYHSDRKGLYLVTEAYWKSQKKIGRVFYTDPETQLPVKKLVDENFILPEGFTQEDSSFSDDQPLNSVSWTWVNEVWKGVKINLKGSHYQEDIYLNVAPIPFQFKGDLNPYEAKLPVCGQVFSVRNSNSMSLVDLMKPYQIFYNVVMNQLYQIAEREVGRFAVMDINMFPDDKDWGGGKAMEKFMLVARELGVVPADTSPQNVRGALAATGGAFPKEFNWDDTGRMMNRAALAEKFEQMALRQVGFNQYRLGAYGSEATAAGVAAGQQTSYAQTESYFTNFSHYLRRCYEMDLSIAQYVQSKNEDITVMNIKSDMSRSFIKLLGTDILLAKLHVYVINSQEYIRQLESLRQLAIQNNTSGASLLDLAELLTADSPAEIKTKLKESAKKIEALQAQQQQLEQQKIDADKEIEMMRLQEAERLLDKKLDNNLDVAYIREGSKIINNDGVTSQDDAKARELDMRSQQQNDTATHSQQKLEIQKQKILADKDYQNKSLALKQAESTKTYKFRERSSQ